MSEIGDYFFEFPASRGVQGGAIVLMMTVPARTLARWDGICASCEKARPTVIANVSAQKAAAARLMDAIVNKTLSVSRSKEASQ